MGSQCVAFASVARIAMARFQGPFDLRELFEGPTLWRFSHLPPLDDRVLAHPRSSNRFAMLSPATQAFASRRSMRGRTALSQAWG
jgi:hypothetical protein